MNTPLKPFAPLSEAPSPTPALTVTDLKFKKIFNQSWLLTIFGLFGVIVIVGIAYLAYHNQEQTRLAQIETQPPPPTVTPFPTPDPIRTWQFYRSPKFNYSLKYPPNWTFSPYNESDPKVVSGTHTLHNYSPTESVKFTKKGQVDWVSFIGTQPAIKLDISAATLTITKEAYLQKQLPKNAKKLDNNDLILGTLPTDLYTFTQQLGSGPGYSLFAFPKPNQVLAINLYIWNSESLDTLNPEDRATLSRLLSTFTFN